MPAPSETDVLNVKALLLLQSSKPESADLLRTMLMDAITHKYGGTRKLKPIPPVAESKTEVVKMKTDETSSIPVKSEMKIDSPPASPELTICVSDDSNDGLEILEGKCSVCKGEKSNNKSAVIECSECHTLYHKECHNPPVTEDLSDPRVVWYCRACNDSLNKNTETTKSSSSKSSHSSTSKSSKTNENTKESSSSSKSTTSHSSKSSSDKRIQNPPLHTRVKVHPTRGFKISKKGAQENNFKFERYIFFP